LQPPGSNSALSKELKSKKFFSSILNLGNETTFSANVLHGLKSVLKASMCLEIHQK
jgi:hypothetical protein